MWQLQYFSSWDINIQEQDNAPVYIHDESLSGREREFHSDSLMLDKGMKMCVLLLLAFFGFSKGPTFT